MRWSERRTALRSTFDMTSTFYTERRTLSSAVAHLVLVRSMERPVWATNEQQWTTHCRKVRARARDLLEGRLGVIASAREFVRLAHWVRADEDPDFTTFIGIDSESDHLPIGIVRREWASDALAEKDRDIRELEDRWREAAYGAARNLLEKYA